MPSSPTGLRTASADSEPPAGNGPASRRGARRRRRPGRKLIGFDRGLGVRFVAGADEAGRGCLAGPLVAAAVLLDLEALGPAQARALGALNDSKQQTPEARAALYPVILRLATRVAIVSRCAPGIDARGLHRTNLAALHDALAGVE
jgi:ribonuclease HII